MPRLGYILLIVLAVMGALDLYFALIWSPPEQVMGDLIRIMYFHVASAWTAFLSLFVTFIAAIMFLIRRKLFWDAVSVCSAEIGIVYTSITLLTGALWAKPIWNTWWTWDPRLTTTLILWFLFIGYLLLRGSIQGLERRARVSAVYAVVAFVDVPIIHMSVRLWRSIHPDVINDTGFNMAPSMVFTLMFGFVTFMMLYGVMLWLRIRTEMMRIRLYQLRNHSRAKRYHVHREEQL